MSLYAGWGDEGVLTPSLKPMTNTPDFYVIMVVELNERGDLVATNPERFYVSSVEGWTYMLSKAARYYRKDYAEMLALRLTTTERMCMATEVY